MHFGDYSDSDYPPPEPERPVTPNRGFVPVTLLTSAGRYKSRIPKHSSWIKHHAHWLLHNCVAHAALAVWPSRTTADFHELTSQWLNQPEKKVRIINVAPPAIPKRFWWVFHNLFVHSAIGLLPCKLTFKLHDWSAEKMDVPGWV